MLRARISASLQGDKSRQLPQNLTSLGDLFYLFPYKSLLFQEIVVSLCSDSKNLITIKWLAIANQAMEN